MLTQLFHNPVLRIALMAWAAAQILKLPFGYLKEGRWNWGLLLSAGGMPSSHSALMVATTHATGLFAGFDSAVFAVTFAMTMIVVYDATGVRRQAGIQAQHINTIIEELLAGHPISQEHLREVLGHTPLEALGGIVLGVLMAQLGYWLWWGLG